MDGNIVNEHANRINNEARTSMNIIFESKIIPTIINDNKNKTERKYLHSNTYRIGNYNDGKHTYSDIV